MSAGASTFLIDLLVSSIASSHWAAPGKTGPANRSAGRHRGSTHEVSIRSLEDSPRALTYSLTGIDNAALGLPA
jgi:hypothetical protein